MIQIFSQVYAFLAALPFIPFGLAWIIAYAALRNRRSSMLLAMDITVIFLVGAVTALFNDVFSSGFGFYLLLLLFLIIFGLLGNAQMRLKGRFHPAKILKSIWRLGFFALCGAYVLLLIVGITLQMGEQ
ncbi:DUF3397 domain-containing protein [Paenibacillus turpanensis]|uniref:DUF3397 domain-containing protein n=1 Tax=Paenibacillus turpanensis TaxID=2689078 RepID=UPI0031332291